jgi:hypothetical protein
VQRLDDGGLLILAEAPASGDDTVTMSNGELVAVIDGSGITSRARAGGANCLSGTGNQLRLFTDQGNIYRFGMELS